jgi:hypothetical protein
MDRHPLFRHRLAKWCRDFTEFQGTKIKISWLCVWLSSFRLSAVQSSAKQNLTDGGTSCRRPLAPLAGLHVTTKWKGMNLSMAISWIEIGWFPGKQGSSRTQCGDLLQRKSLKILAVIIPNSMPYLPIICLLIQICGNNALTTIHKHREIFLLHLEITDRVQGYCCSRGMIDPVKMDSRERERLLIKEW